MTGCPNCKGPVAFVRRRAAGKVGLRHGEPLRLFREHFDVVVPTNSQIRELMPIIARNCAVAGRRAEAEEED